MKSETEQAAFIEAGFQFSEMRRDIEKGFIQQLAIFDDAYLAELIHDEQSGITCRSGAPNR